MLAATQQVLGHPHLRPVLPGPARAVDGARQGPVTGSPGDVHRVAPGVGEQLPGPGVGVGGADVDVLAEGVAAEGALVGAQARSPFAQFPLVADAVVVALVGARSIALRPSSQVDEDRGGARRPGVDDRGAGSHGDVHDLRSPQNGREAWLVDAEVW